MIFNSLQYALFLPVVFILYWLLGTQRRHLQNVLLLLASYFFYGCWDWRFLFLLAFSTLLDYFTGIKIYQGKTNRNKKIWLIISVGINLGFLAIFKYYNFFIVSFVDFIQNFGLNANISTLKIILPVGISFYTFHGLSYVFDIYNGRVKPTRNWVDYTLFVSFFPLLVAGPIERATHLLPQVEKGRVFDYHKAVDGLRQILWGLFKKIVIADSCAAYANQIFALDSTYSGLTLLLGAVFFAFQIYGDFSGYSDIALGTARLFGFELLQNFKYPYFSRSIAEFWRRWHISLSSWFKDYLYIPLGGSSRGTFYKIRNTFIIFLVSGFWHGANWTFIVWGLLNALFIMPSIIFNTNRNDLEIVAKGRMLPSFRELINILITFLLTSFAWIFFRSENITQAFDVVARMLVGLTTKSGYGDTYYMLQGMFLNGKIILLLLFIVVEWLGREQNYAIERLFLGYPKIISWSFYYVLVIFIALNSGSEQPFIYFQF